MNFQSTHVPVENISCQIAEHNLNFVIKYLQARQIQNINALWEIPVNYDKNIYDQFDNFATLLMSSSKKMIADIYIY